MKFAVLALSLLQTPARDAADLLEGPLRIPPGESQSFPFEAGRSADAKTLVEVTSRIDAPSLSGSLFVLKVRVNGRDVDAGKGRGVSRLANKSADSPVAAGLRSSWYAPAGWRVVYAPNFDLARRQPFYEGDPYTLALDVTDLVEPGVENRIEITNAMTEASAQRAKVKGELVVERLSVRVEPGKSPLTLATRLPTPVVNAGRPAPGPAEFAWTLHRGGGFTVETGGRRWDFSSEFSYPNAGKNRLVPAPGPDRGGESGWHVNARSAGDEATVSAGGRHYAIRRTLRRFPGRIEVEDAIENLDERRPLGLAVAHRVGLDGLVNPTVRLAGNPDPAVNDYYSPGNPSVHVEFGEYGLGLLCEDDVFRNQARLFFRAGGAAEPAVMGLRTEMLRLAPGETYSLRWSIYPVASRDYFDFLNAVRADWKVNTRVEGAWRWGFQPDQVLATPDDVLRRDYARLGIRYAVLDGGWVDRTKDPRRIGFGVGVMVDDYWADYRRRIRKAAEKLRLAVPGVKVLGYYDTQRDTSEGGPEQFRDSWHADSEGNPVTTDWGGAYSRTYSMVATLENRYGKAMLDVAEHYLDELGLDGLYWDEMEVIGFGAPLITYNAADGHSCLLDPARFTIRREVGLATLLGERHRLAVVDLVRSKKKLILGNGPTCTRALREVGIQRMTEIQHNDRWGYEGLLQTPLGYMGDRKDAGNVVRALNLGFLPVGRSEAYEYEIPRFLFPFTPIELHAGYLLGEERIVASHGGSYGWPGERRLVQVYHFDERGSLTGVDHPTTVGREARTEVGPLDGGLVVLERLPIEVDPRGGEARVSGVRYTDRGILLRLKADHGAEIRVSDGRFRVASRRSFLVDCGGDARQETAAPDGSLSVVVGNQYDGEIRIVGQGNRGQTPPRTR